MTTAHDARAHESRAADHAWHGRMGDAVTEYRAAAAAWRAVADHFARHGETLISATFQNEARKNDRKADNATWEAGFAA